MIFYGYDKCSTCRSAKKFLKDNQISFEDKDITLNPPSKKELRAALQSGFSIKKLLNTSGEVYRSMRLKDKLEQMTDDDVLDLLAQNGKLIKRPFVIDGKKSTVGFKEDNYREQWL